MLWAVCLMTTNVVQILKENIVSLGFLIVIWLEISPVKKNYGNWRFLKEIIVTGPRWNNPPSPSFFGSPIHLNVN